MTKGKKEYIERINLVIDYIEKHLGEQLTLDTLAEVALFSKFHFHRLFKEIVGETLNNFIRRLRLQASFQALRYHPEESITTIALRLGFSSSSNFSTAFKTYYKYNPREIRDIYLSKDLSKIGEVNSKIQEAYLYPEEYNGFIEKEYIDKKEMVELMKVVVKDYPDFNVAYVRNIGSYFEASKAWDKLTRWAGSNNLINQDSRFIGISHDDPEITETSKLRYDACMTIPEGVKTSGEVGNKTIQKGLYATYEYYGPSTGIKEVYSLLFKEWLPNSTYEVDDRCCIEICLNNPDEDPKGYIKTEICMPIKK